MMMIVEEPRIDVALAQGFLDGVEVHGQKVILHDAAVLANAARCYTNKL
jgi:hypothetical protein